MPSSFRIQTLAVPASLLIFAVLAGSSQYLFHHLDPGPLQRGENIKFNLLIAAFLTCYARSWFHDPGFVEPLFSSGSPKRDNDAASRSRWCRKCDAPKPPRAHHCKECKRCVMKMDHHCPWTGNCVGYRTLPHFIRFLFYSVIAMLYLGYFLVLRLLALWEQRQLSISLGPSQWALGHLVALCAINLIACFMISMLFCISVYCLGANMTAIEGLQIERHKKLLKRARRNGGCVNGPGGVRIRLERHEFPYDIGIYQNIAQGMGSYLPWMWFWPLAPSPRIQDAKHFETNGFLKEGLSWPPPDPEKMHNDFKRPTGGNGFVHGDDKRKDDEWMEAVNRRQKEDRQRRAGASVGMRRRHVPSLEDTERDDSEDDDSESSLDDESGDEDDGIDEAGDEDDHVPLSTLIARRRGDQST